MVDPLSIAASIAGIAEFTGTVFKHLIKFSKDVKNAPFKVRELADQVGNLAGIMQNLNLLASSLDDANFKCSFKAQHLQSCHNTLNKIQRKLVKAQADLDTGKPLNNLLGRLKWPFTNSETEELKSDLSEHCKILQLALSADSMETLLKCLAKQEELHKMVERKLSIDNRAEMNKRRDRVVKFFLRVNPQDNFDMSKDLRHPMTGLWLTESDDTFQQWKRDQNGKLWLSGIPGGGKTVLCGAVIDELLQESNDLTAVSYAFCDYKDSKTHLPENILAAIAVQLAQQKEEAFDILEECFNDLNSNNQLPKQPRVELLSKVIEDMAAMYDKVFIVVDGLDECGDNVELMTQSLKSLANKSDTINIALFSRKDEDIREELETDYDHIEIEAHTEDLEAYTLDELDKRKPLKKLRVTNPELREEIIHTLVQGARGMFRWVACQIDHIGNLPNNNARRKALKELPPTLFGTYDRVLDKARKSSPEVQAFVRKALHWVALGISCFNIPALCEAISVQDNVDLIDKDDLIDEDEVFRRCGCLLRKSLDRKYFEISHFTVVEYLQSNSSKSSVGEFRYSVEEAFRSYTTTSLRFLTFPCFDRKLTTVLSTEAAYRLDRYNDHPFYCFATRVFDNQWSLECNDSVWESIMADKSIVACCKRLFDMNRPGCFASWCLEWSIDFQDFFDDAAPPPEVMATALRFAISTATTPLHFAAVYGMPELCKFLLQQGAGININGPCGTPLWALLTRLIDGVRIAHSSALNTLQILLDHGADTTVCFSDETNPFFKPQSAKYLGKNALAAAATSRNIDDHYLLQFVRPTTAVSEDGIKGLSKRLQRKRLDENLLQAILEISTSDSSPPQWRPLASTALLQAKRRTSPIPNHSQHTLVDALGAKDFVQAIMLAIDAGQMKDLSTLIANSRFHEDNGTTARQVLYHAAETRTLESCQAMTLLLDSGIHPDILDSEIENCLRISCTRGNAKVAELLLLKRGANVASCNSDGETAWHISASHGNTELLNILFEVDPDPLMSLSTTSKNKMTPISCAIMSGHSEAALQLLNWCPADPAYFQSRNMLLHSAAEIGSQELFSGLLAKGVYLPAHGPDGSTPLHHLGASSTPRFVHYLTSIYDPSGLNNYFESPFERYLEQRFFYSLNREDEDEHSPKHVFGDTPASLYKEILVLLLPPDFIFHTVNEVKKPLHVWEILCNAVRRKRVCSCEVRRLLGLQQQPRCNLLFLSAFRTLLGQGVLLSYESSRNQPGIISLLTALSERPTEGKLCSPSIDSLLSSVMEHSALQPLLKDVDSGYKLLKRVIAENHSRLTDRLLQYGLDVHHHREGECSPFEVACWKANMKTFAVVLAAADPSRLNDTLLSGCNFIDLVVQGESEDQERKIRALSDNGSLIRHGNDPEPAIAVAGRRKNWAVVNCLVDLGADPFAKTRHDWTAVHYAAHYGGSDVVKRVSKLISIAPKWQATCTVVFEKKLDEQAGFLFLAGCGGCDDILEFLVDRKLCADVNAPTRYGVTPLHAAAGNGKLSTVEGLLKRGAKLNIQTNNGKLPIDCALQNGHLAMVQFLLTAGSRPPAGFGDQMVKNLPANRHTHGPLANSSQLRDIYFEQALLNGNLEACKSAVHQGCTINQALSSCLTCTPLFAAIRSKQENIVEWLLDMDASATSVSCQHNKDWQLPQHAARFLSPSCLKKVLTLSLQAGICWYTVSVSPIYIAVSRGENEILQTILTHIKTNIEAYRNVFEPYLLSDSQSLSNEAILSLLVNQINYEKFYEETALHLAAYLKGNLRILRMLIDHGAEIDARDEDQSTPLMLAASQNNINAVKYLLNCGAVTDLTDQDCDSAMTLAVSKGHIEIVKLLDAKSSFSLFYMSPGGRNLLSFATSLPTFKYLVSRGVDLLHVDQDGMCALEHAIDEPELLDYLIRSRLISKMPILLYNPFTTLEFQKDLALFKRIYNSIPRATSRILLNLRTRWPSPLCKAAMYNLTQTAGFLLDLQVNIEQDGSIYGTPLMCGATFGKLDMVKFLVRSGAKLVYTDKKGMQRSVFQASLLYPEIMEWLLVKRFHDQKKVRNSPHWGLTIIKPWSGKRVVMVKLGIRDQRRREESTLDYCKRLLAIKKERQGRRIYDVDILS
ncbi:ankyrin repeat-containing domain protein [Mariannaea sp. PMI_226]|nr:ankyrin repeat-containing domain protein [Mariannaea sp. PMI_226]